MQKGRRFTVRLTGFNRFQAHEEITLRICAKLWRQLERMEGEND